MGKFLEWLYRARLEEAYQLGRSEGLQQARDLIQTLSQELFDLPKYSIPYTKYR